MFRKFIKKSFSVGLAVILTLSAVSGHFFNKFFETSITAYSQTGTVNTQRLNVRSGPGTSYSKVGSLSLNTEVTINSSSTGSDGYVWYQVSFNGGSGYIRSDYVYVNQVYSVSDSDFESYMTSQGFPESYKNGLRGLHEKYPNWIFEAQNTGLDWNSAVLEESKIGKNLVSSTSISSWKSIQTGAFDWANNYWPGFDGSTWVQASQELIAHYMDPRNFLSDPYIFQFEIQTYDPSVQTKEGLMAMVDGTFLDSEAIVPVEGSSIEGGSIIPGSTYTSGQSVNSGSTNSGNGSSESSSSIGPGGSSNSSSVIIAPGVVLNSDLTAESSYSADSSSVCTNNLKSTFLEDLTATITSFAAGWVSNDVSGAIIWRYLNDDGSSLTNGWYWLDGNKDGIAECYYFYADGTMAASTTVDSWMVDSEGRWVEDGVIQTKSSGSTQSEGQLKSVPYVDIIMEAASQSQLSPYVIASTILQEQGSGNSSLISGSDSTYPGVYNYFNTGAYAHDGMSAVTAGLKYASEQGWTSIEKSIIGGAKSYATSYVNRGQDTYYLKKFNVQGSNLYNHQYMTHVLAAAEEGAKVSSAYGDLKNYTLRFKIPVYNNMPEELCPLPTVDGSPNNKLKTIEVVGFTLTPTFNMDTEEYSLIVDSSISSVSISASAIDSTATVSGVGNINLSVGLNYINIIVTAGNGTTRTYRINVTRREDQSITTAGSSSGTSPGSPVPGSSTSTSVPQGTVVIGESPAS